MKGGLVRAADVVREGYYAVTLGDTLGGKGAERENQGDSCESQGGRLKVDKFAKLKPCENDCMRTS
jgi:hypothetical protein